MLHNNLQLHYLQNNTYTYAEKKFLSSFDENISTTFFTDKVSVKYDATQKFTIV